MAAVSQAKAAAATAGPHQAWARRSLKHGSGQHAEAQRSPDAAKDHHSGWKSVWQSHRHEEEDDTHAGWHGGPARGDDGRHTHRGRHDDDEDDDSDRAFERVRTREEAQRVVDEVTARAEQVCEVTNGMAPAGAMLAILVLLGSSVLHCATARASQRAAKILAPARHGDAPAPGTAAVLRGAGAPAHATLHKGGAVTHVDPPAAPAPATEGASASAAGYPLAGVAAARARLADRMRGMFAGRQGYAAVNVEEDPPRAGPVGSGGGAAPVAPPAAPAGAPLSYDEYLRAVAQGRA